MAGMYLAALLLAAHAHAQPQWLSPYDSGKVTVKTPCPLLRSVFKIEGTPASGTVRVAGLGHFQLSLNGARVGESLIDEPWSQYNKTIYCQEFDISKLLRKGKNSWGVMLGNSFWHVGPANDTMRYVKTDAMPDFSRGYPFLLWLEARITTTDGREVVVRSDGSWKWSDGPLTFSTFMPERITMPGGHPQAGTCRILTVAPGKACGLCLLPLPALSLTRVRRSRPSRCSSR